MWVFSQYHIGLYSGGLCSVECDLLNFTNPCTIGKVIGLALACVQTGSEGHWWVWQGQHSGGRVSYHPAGDGTAWTGSGCGGEGSSLCCVPGTAVITMTCAFLS